MKKEILFLVLLMVATCLTAQHNAVVQEYSTEITYTGSKLIETRSIEIQINDRESAHYAEIGISVSEDERLDIHEAAITDLQGNVLRKLKKKEITTSSDISTGTFYEDRLVKEFELKWDVYPYRIRYSYSQSSSQYLTIANWIPYVYPRLPVRRAILTIDLPKSMICYSYHSPEIEYSENMIADRVNGIYRIENLKTTSGEIYSPPFMERVPKVLIRPEQFFYGVQGSSVDWQAFGAWIAELNHGADELIEADRQMVDELIRDLDTDIEKIRVLYEHLQNNTRYVNISLDIGGLKPYPASYVSRKGYGDCKALTIYMKALLKHAEIDAYYTLVRSGKNPVRINSEQPGQQFDHVILAVPLGQDTLWLENTSSVAPVNYLGDFTQGRLGLLVDGLRSHLVKIPAMEMEDVLVKSHFLFELNSQGTGIVTLHMIARGDRFEEICYMEREGNSRQEDRYLERLVGLNDFEMSEWKTGMKEGQQAQLDITIQGKTGNQYRKIGERIVISPRNVALPDFEKIEKRDFPVRIFLPRNHVDSLEYRVSGLNRYKVVLPEKKEIHSKYGYYSCEGSQSGHSLIVKKVFRLNRGDYSLEEYPEFYAFLESIHQAEKKSSIILKP